MLSAAGWPLLQLPTAQAGWRNIPNPSQQEVFHDYLGHPVRWCAWRRRHVVQISCCLVHSRNEMNQNAHSANSVIWWELDELSSHLQIWRDFDKEEQRILRSPWADFQISRNTLIQCVIHAFSSSLSPLFDCTPSRSCIVRARMNIAARAINYIVKPSNFDLYVYCWIST